MLLRVVTVKEREIGCDWVCMPRWLLKRKRERERERERERLLLCVYTPSYDCSSNVCRLWRAKERETESVYACVYMLISVEQSSGERERAFVPEIRMRE